MNLNAHGMLVYFKVFFVHEKNEKQQNMEIRKMEIQNDIGVGHDVIISVLNYNNHLQVVDM